MSGHSKWATIKHKKGALDAKRGKIFTRLIKEIAMAAKSGGDPDMNPRLRTAILAAKSENMPADNIKRAIQRGTGELPGTTYEEFVLEGYGPGGVALLAEISTDNRNRTVSEIRHVFGKNNGNMAAAGAVAYMFHKKGDIIIPKSAAKEDDLMNIILEAGGEDLKDDGENWEILTAPSAYESVLEAVKKAGITPVSSSVSMVPDTYIKLEGQQAAQMIRLMEALEDNDDVQNVHANFDIDEKLLEEVAGWGSSGGSGPLSCQTAPSLDFDDPITACPDDPIILRSDTSPIAHSSGSLFNTAEEKFVEKRELT